MKATVPDISQVPYNTFSYWFIRDTNNTFRVISTIDNSDIAQLYESQDSCIITFLQTGSPEVDTAMKSEFNRYKLRPEYRVGSQNSEFYKFTDQSDGVLKYNTLMVGCALIRAYRNTKKDPDTVYGRILKCIEWLESTDFYVSPSSRYYHEAYPAGNLTHTLRVAMKVAELEYVPSFIDVDCADACLVALVHDWCKIGLYKSSTRNVKNEQTGQWETVPSYTYYDKPMTSFGHGVSSLWLASKYFNMSYEESLAVRWHMGEYNVAPNEMNDLHNANTYYPIVQLLQFADRLACTQY